MNGGPDAPATPAPTIVAYPDSVNREATQVAVRFSLLAAATPLIPVPVLDSIAVSAIQIAMISELCSLYGKPFSKNVGGSLIGAAGAGAVSLLFSTTGPGRALKRLVESIPAVGPLLRWGAGPVMLAGYTYLLGMAFIQHFETGGSFESFDRKQFSNYVARSFKDRFNERPLISVD